MADHFTLSFAPGTRLVEEPGSEHVTVQAARRQWTLRLSWPGALAALRTLAGEGASEQQLVEQTPGAGPEQVAELLFLVRKLADGGVLAYTVHAGGEPVATAVPISADFRLARVESGPDRRWVLSRFAFLHREEAALILEAPVSHARILLHRWTGAALAAVLARAADSEALAAAVPGVTAVEAEAFVRLLAGAGMLSVVGAGGRPTEDDQAALAQWEFHDLLYHTRSREGRHHGRHGGTYRFQGQIPPLPAVKPRMSEAVVPLHKPDLDRLAESDMPLAAVVERRRSIRAYGTQPLTTAQLGHFLYRTVRLRRLIAADKQELCSRPYPSGGAVYELEFYPVIRVCEGIAPGLYHYDPQAHLLCKLTDRTPETDSLLQNAWWANGGQCVPQVLIVVAARFQRLMWKYQAMAYAAILKHVGVVYQTMYLVATAMGLAPCGLGSGNSDLFARAAGLDYYAETSVGEFMLGSQQETDGGLNARQPTYQDRNPDPQC
jgi:SagB-type dehydrogenase family enzyme